MRIVDFLWLSTVVEKIIRKHDVSPDEAEEVFVNRPQFRSLEKGRVAGEDLYGALGQTDDGRYLTVVFILKAGHIALIVTARDMNAAERKRYGRKQD